MSCFQRIDIAETRARLQLE